MSGPDKTKPGVAAPAPSELRRPADAGTGKGGDDAHGRSPSRSLFARKGAATAEGFAPFTHDARHLAPAETGATPSSVREPDDAGYRATTDAPGLAASQPMPSKTVLIVEDDALNMKLFRDLLAVRGYAILQATDGREAFRIARAKRPDLILMDMQLPEVSGLRVTKWIRDDADLNSIPVIAVTAFVSQEDEEIIRKGGCQDYIAKPISVPGFVRAIEKFLG